MRKLTQQPLPLDEDLDRFYPFPSLIQNEIAKHLERNGQDFGVYVTYVGAYHYLDYIITTKGGEHFGDSPPVVVEGENDIVVREWLEANGMC